MGSRGSGSGRKTKSMVDNVNGYKYNGVKNAVDKLEKALNNAKSTNAISKVAIALKKQDEFITNEIERLHNGTADVMGSENALLTQRRRIRLLQKKAKF